MISAGVEGQIPPYMMTYHPERWAGAPKQEFVRPAPKPLPSRYNGVSSTAPNGTRLTHSARSLTQHQPIVAAAASTPVNLTAHKDDLSDDQTFYTQRVFPQPTFNPYHFSGLYPPYPLLRPTSGYAPLSPLESYSPTTPTGNGSFLPPQVPAYSPPTAHKSGLVRIQSPGGQTMVRDKKSPAPFKVPSGKEGSLKHRILTRPEDAPQSSLDQLRETRKRISAAVVSPPRSPAIKTNNNNGVSAKFAKGSLIQLADGKLRNVEDMRTEDFVQSAEMSPELRLAESTVVKIADNPKTGTAAIMLSYNERRAQVEVESPVEHPFFVYGQGWASCHVEKTLKSYGLEVHKLRVGDVLISLMPREPMESMPPSNATTTTTTTTQSSANFTKEHQHLMYNLMKSRDYIAPPQSHSQPPPQIHQDAPMSPDSMRKRRWSAPDHICDDDEQQQHHTARRMRVE